MTAIEWILFILIFLEGIALIVLLSWMRAADQLLEQIVDAVETLAVFRSMTSDSEGEDNEPN